MVGTTGFEPATSRTPSVRATRLRYVPTGVKPMPEAAPRYVEIARNGGIDAVPRLSLSPAFEKGQEAAERVAQIEEHLAVQEFGGVLWGSAGRRM